MAYEQTSMFHIQANWIPWKAADLNWLPVLEKGVKVIQSAQIPIRQHRDFRWLWVKTLNYVWHDSELIVTKICSQKGCKWSAMFESHVETCIDWTSFNFWFEDFLSNILLIYFVIDQPSIFQSQWSVLNFKFTILTFLTQLGERATLWAWSKNCAKRKPFVQSISNAIECIHKRLAVKVSSRSCLA